MLGHHWHTSETPFKLRFDDDDPLMARLSGICIHSSTHQKPCQSWNPSEKTSWIRACRQTHGSKNTIKVKQPALLLP